MQGSDFRGLPDLGWLFLAMAFIGICTTFCLIGWVLQHIRIITI